MKTVNTIPALTNHAPQLVNDNRTSGILMLRAPSIRRVPTLDQLEAGKLDLEQMLGLKQRLREYVRLLYRHGVAYQVKHDSMFAAQKVTYHWAWYLGGWWDADFCSDPCQLESSWWNAKETEQLDEIERLFELLVARYKGLRDERRGLKPHRVDRGMLQQMLQPPLRSSE